VARFVHCVKLGEELPGLQFAPVRGELGRRIYEQVSEQAWKMWLQHSTMVINEYRLNPATPDAQKVLKEQMERFFFGDGAAPPPDFVPEDDE
jgi:Fe-S cluster biosynthesis and repair protein YggX